MRSMRTDVSIKEVNWSSLKSLLPYLFEFKTRIFLALLCLVGAKLANVGLPFILKNIVDYLDNNSAVHTITLLPLGLLVAYGTLRFANVLFGEIRDTLFGRVTERAMRRIGLKVFNHLHSLELEFHLNRQTGGIFRDIDRGTNGISFLLRFMVFNIVPTLLEILLIMILLGSNYSIIYALIVFLSVASYVGFSIYATERRTKYVRQMNTADSNTNTRAIDSLLNYETVKYFTNEEYESKNYDDDLANWELARQKSRLSLFFLNGGQALIISLAMTTAMILAASEVINNTMTLGDFVLINAFMMQIFMPLNFLGFVYREMKGAMANIEKMFSLLNKKPKINDLDNAQDIIVAKGGIKFNNIFFGYSAERNILNSVSFEVKPQQKVAVVGSSGAGKSTLFKLLFRFYDVDKGSIEIDGQNISHVTQTSLRQSIGVVPQDTVLFNATIFDNIRYGRLEATEDEVDEAIRLAHLSDFIDQLPEGKQTLVGERGLKLSGGEKQRVAIARAILKRPRIMVFDEATSSLDSQSEQSILEAIKEISFSQTTLVIAHRLSTIVDSDTIVVLDQGSIVEQGSHQKLMEKNGAYAQLWNIQQSEKI